MIGQYLISLQEPENKTDWFILNTNIATYEFRLGGLKLTTIKSQGRIIDLKFDKPKIMRVMTDDFAVYIELDNGFCIVHSDTFIDSHGETSFEIYIRNSDIFINNGGLEGMLPIKSYA